MLLKKITVIASAAALAAAPTIASAQAAPAVYSAPAEERVEGNEMFGRGYILPLLGVIALVVAVILLTRGGDDRPVSP
jgi:uncharacterized membrane protein